MVSIPILNFFERIGQLFVQIRAALFRALLAHLRAPCVDVTVVAAEQHLGHLAAHPQG